MAPTTLKLGSKVGEHGSYDFYKSFRCMKGGKWRQVSLGNFFFVKVENDGPVSLAELQLVWTGRQNEVLTSVRLYYLPEQTPDGRQSQHGADELIATDKIVLYARDLIKWVIYEGVDWTMGLEIRKTTNQNCRCHDTSGLSCSVQILPYSVYCRLRSTIEQLKLVNLNIGDLTQHPHIQAMVGFGKLQTNCYILFSRDTFTCPQLDNHQFRCDHLAPKLKGRPRKKVKPIKLKVTSEVKIEDPEEPSTSKAVQKPKNKLSAIIHSRDLFLKLIHKYLKDGGGPVPKVPSIDGQKVDLYLLFKNVHQIGGFGEVGRKRMWKNLFDKMGGNPNNTSAATRIKRIYERFLLSYEHHLKSVYKEEYKTIRVTNAKHKQTIVKTEPKSYKPTEVKTELTDKTARIPEEMEHRTDSPSPRRPTTRQLSCTIKFGRTIQLDEIPKQDGKVKTETVSARSTWTVPGAMTPKPEQSGTMKQPATGERPIKQEKPDEVETKPEVIKERYVVDSTKERSAPAEEETKWKEHKEPRPAHCLSKALMPLNVLGPCHPNKLVAAQMSPWKLRFNVQYDNPDSISGESLKKLKEIKVEPSESAVDMTRESLIKLEKLEQERIRRAAEKAQRKAAEAAEQERKRKAAESFRESADGALDLSVKKPKMELIVKREIPGFEYPQDAPINCSLKPEKRLSTQVNHGRPQPSHPQPRHPQPRHPQPSHPQPSHPQPIHPQPIHPQPGHPQPGHPQPSHPQPSHPQPSHPQPSHPQPSQPQPSQPQQSHPRAIGASNGVLIYPTASVPAPQRSSQNPYGATLPQRSIYDLEKFNKTSTIREHRQEHPERQRREEHPQRERRQEHPQIERRQQIPPPNRQHDLSNARRHDSTISRRQEASAGTNTQNLVSARTQQLMPPAHTQQTMQSPSRPQNLAATKRPNELMSPRRQHDLSYSQKQRPLSSPTIHGASNMHHIPSPHHHTSSPSSGRIQKPSTSGHHNQPAPPINRHHSSAAAHHSSTGRTAPILSPAHSCSAPHQSTSTQRQTARPKPESNQQPHAFQRMPPQQSSGRPMQTAQHVYPPPPLQQTHSQKQTISSNNRQIPATIASSQLKPAHSQPPNTQPSQMYNTGNSANLPAPPRLMNMSHLAGRNHSNDIR